jgi:hypothetical protein
MIVRNLIVHQRRYQLSDNNKHVDYWEVVIVRNLIVHQRRYQPSDNNKHVDYWEVVILWVDTFVGGLLSS